MLWAEVAVSCGLSLGVKKYVDSFLPGLASLLKRPPEILAPSSDLALRP